MPPRSNPPDPDAPGVVHRECERSVSEPTFEDLRRRVDDGLAWGVGALVTDEDGRVLLVRERGGWAAPGGGVEPGEPHRDALRREVREETGVAVTVDGLRAVTDQTVVHGDRSVRFQFATYAATPETTALADDPGVPGEDIEAVAWHERLPPDTLDRSLLATLR